MVSSCYIRRTGEGLGNVGAYLGQKPSARVSRGCSIKQKKGLLEGNGTHVAFA